MDTTKENQATTIYINSEIGNASKIDVQMLTSADEGEV